MGHLPHVQHLPHLPHLFGRGGRDDAYTAQVRRAGPVLWWRAASTALEVGSPTLTLSGSPVQTAPGAIKNDGNTCTRFVSASSQYARIANHASIELTSAGGIELWFRWGVSGAIDGLYGKNNASGELLIYTENNKITAYVSGAADALLSAALTVGLWYHVVVTWSGTSWVLYVNGEVSDTLTGTAPSATATDNLVGAYANGGDGFLQGWVDELVIFNRLLTAAEVAARYAAGAKTALTLASAVVISASQVWFTFNEPLLVAQQSTADAAAFAAFEVAAGGGAYLSPLAVDITHDVGSLQLQCYYDTLAVVVGDAYRINSDVLNHALGAGRYVKSPVSGTLASP